MDRAEIVAALTALGERLHARSIEGEMYVVGGAAIALAYSSRRSTRDIDAVFEPKAAVYQAAAEVAELRGLPVAWLNDGVKGFLVGSDPHAAPVLEVPGLRCLAASPRMLLALKVLAHRTASARTRTTYACLPPSSVWRTRPAFSRSPRRSLGTGWIPPRVFS